MKFGIFIFSIVFIVMTATASALELKNPEADKRHLTIELEVVPTPPQKDFEQYVQEQAIAAQARGGLPAAALERLTHAWTQFATA